MRPSVRSTLLNKLPLQKLYIPLPSTSPEERRNFWKMHAEQSDMVAVLLQNVQSNKKLRTFVEKNKLSCSGDPVVAELTFSEVLGGGLSSLVPAKAAATATGTAPGSGYLAPQPPKDPKPSAQAGDDTSSIGSARKKKMKNYCGIQVSRVVVRSCDIATITIVSIFRFIHVACCFL
jgi:hypothetical protein